LRTGGECTLANSLVSLVFTTTPIGIDSADRSHVFEVLYTKYITSFFKGKESLFLFLFAVNCKGISRISGSIQMIALRSFLLHGHEDAVGPPFLPFSRCASSSSFPNNNSANKVSPNYIQMSSFFYNIKPYFSIKLGEMYMQKGKSGKNVQNATVMCVPRRRTVRFVFVLFLLSLYVPGDSLTGNYKVERFTNK
jgi:hypothetical protein